MGHFALEGSVDNWRISVLHRVVQPQSWTEQSYPFFSGRAIYRQRFILPGEFAGQRVFLEPSVHDDVLEVSVNGTSAGVRL